jgi:PAS domain S-box-containing protein
MILALRASELSYRRLFEAAQDGILILDASTGRVIDANPFLIKLLGISHEGMVGKTVGDLSPFKDLVSNQKMLEKLQKMGYVRYEDLPLETWDGRKIAVEFVSNVYQAGDDRVIQCNIRDITARKQVEESRARLAMAVEQAAETVVITDTQGTILYVNPALEKTSGYSLPEALGQNPRLLKSGKHDAAFYRVIWDTLRRGEVWSGHFVNRHKSGSLYQEDATISPVRDATGTIVNFVAVKRDVTREMQLEANVNQAQKMESIGQLAGGVAHDFNNILASIQMQSDLLKDGGSLSPEQLESVDGILASVHRAAALTRQLLLFSRREVFQPRDMDLSESITGTAQMLKRIIGENITMQVNVTVQSMFLHADPGMMDQVLLNLVVNARDAMPEGGQLIIETLGVELDHLAVAQCPSARPGSFVRLSVSDTGCGIPPDVLPHIFEPFFTTKEVGKGTGLGLATVFGIVQQHQGWINVDSEMDQGTTFRIYLPRRAMTALPAAAPKAPAPLCGGSETILLVEDDPVLRATVHATLTRLGYRIFEAATGAKALGLWGEHRGDIKLLLTDLMMPDGMTGFALAQRLLEDEPNLSVIYMSGHGAEIFGQDMRIQDGVNFLSKPFTAQKLALALRENLERRL